MATLAATRKTQAFSFAMLWVFRSKSHARAKTKGRSPVAAIIG